MERLERISCHNFVEIDGYIFFSNWFYNGLFVVEYETGKTTFLGHFSNEKLTEKNIHWELILKEKKILFLPRRGHYVHIYDLSNRCIDSIEIRKETDEFNVIKEVMIQGDYLYFFLAGEKYPIKKMNIETLKAIDVNDQLELRGEHISKEKCPFPMLELLKAQFNMEGSYFSWKKLSNGKWCGFMPRGREMLWYTDGIPKLEIKPLIVENEKKLKEYLYKLARELVKEGPVQESQIIGIKEFNDKIVDRKDLTCDNFASCHHIEKRIWEILNTGKRNLG